MGALGLFSSVFTKLGGRTSYYVSTKLNPYIVRYSHLSWIRFVSSVIKRFTFVSEDKFESSFGCELFVFMLSDIKNDDLTELLPTHFGLYII